MKTVYLNVDFKDPEKEICEVLKDMGAKNIRTSSKYDGARFEFQLDNLIDANEFKRRAIQSIESLRRKNYRSY